MAADQRGVASRLGGRLLAAHTTDVGAARERARQARLKRLALLLAAPAAFLWARILDGHPFDVFALPAMPEDPILYLLPVMLMVALLATAAMPLASGRSPHLLVRPEQIDVRFCDVKGLAPIVDEVEKTLNTFLAYALYRDRLGGSPRRGLLFEGAPGTGKTHLAKAMAREAGVPFLFVSATSFQSMWYGATARKIRSYFRVLRAIARREGGAIGFIEEIDAIATARGGLAATPMPSGDGRLSLQRFASTEGTGGVVNELLVQLQSFDTPPAGQRLRAGLTAAVNRFLPAYRQLRTPPQPAANILLIAATNRADSLDPALLRPGRFDRRLEFTLPAKAARRELLDYFLQRKAHSAELDDGGVRDQLVAQTLGYTPVQLEHLLDEALIVALRDGRDQLAARDVHQARLVSEVGMPMPVTYTDRERRTVATHEAGHAVVAYLSGERRLEVLSIVKRKDSLGLLAHGDLDEVYTRTRTQMYALVEIALGGMCAEQLAFGEAGTGPSGDLAHATQVAAEIVGSAGMGDTLVSLAAVRNTAFNDTNLVGRVLADPVARPQVERLLEHARARVLALLGANAHLVAALRDALLARDELIGDDITAVLQAAGQRDPVRGEHQATQPC